ncbi:MAG: undecaprenyl-diphosphate phosphatase [Lachnospiraceae bacterium]|nr:undecaprenyl-diphosphate phosphatase [Lachnospiraceae bacterium]
MLEIVKALLFGIVEGITEWLPISSTGHMIILDEFVRLNVREEFWDLFLVVIQLGAILAVVILYWNSIFPMNLTKKEEPFWKKDILVLWGKILLACVPAAVIGLAFDDLLDKYLYNFPCVALALIVFGILFIIVEKKKKGQAAKINTIAELDYKTVLLIGVFQLIAAIFPGTSRSGATIVGALLLSVSRVVAAEFTFYLAIPVMCGASLLKLVKFMTMGLSFALGEVMILLVGCISAFVVSILVIKLLMGYIKKHDFIPFGIYRIALGIVLLIYFGLNL